MRRWALVCVAMLVGAALGGLFHLLMPPVYETKAVITVNVDYAQTGPITEIDLDHVQNAAGGIAFWATASLPDRFPGLVADVVELSEWTMIERRRSAWELHVRHENPLIAQTVANAWAESTMERLIEANQSAIQAQVIWHQIVLLEDCLANNPATKPEPMNCDPFENAQASDVDGLLEQHKIAVADSRGLISPMEFGLTELASLPTAPVRYGRNTFVFSGAMVGFLVGIWMVGSGKRAKERSE